MSHLSGGISRPCDKATDSWFSDPISGNGQTGEGGKSKKGAETGNQNWPSMVPQPLSKQLILAADACSSLASEK